MKQLLPLLALAVSWTHAGEHTIQPETFTASLSLDATFLPDKVIPFSIDPASWAEFKLLDVKDHGASVKMDEPVAILDVEAIERRMADDAGAAQLRKMGLAAAERELKDLEQATKWKLATAERGYERTKFDLAYFKETGRPLAEERAVRLLDRAKRSLEYQEEELKQLLKMYAEDDLTEETEEIILKRQRAAVDSAKFSLKQAEVEHAWTMKHGMPRKAVDMEQSFLDAEMLYESTKLALPRALEQKRLEVKKLQVADTRLKQTEAEIVADRQLMAMVSPVAGRVYHGEIADGRWSPGQTAKFVKKGGLVPPRTVFATVVPDGVLLKLHAFVDEGIVLQLKEGQKGHVSPAAAPRRRLAVTVESVSLHPETDGKYHVVLVVGALPEDLTLVAGMKGKAKLITFQKDDAIAIPVKALEEAPDGSFRVQIKLADGESEKRPVTVGRESNGLIEVLTGLEAGQVVIVPGEEAE